MKKILLLLSFLTCLMAVSGCGHSHVIGKLEFDEAQHWYACKEQGCTEKIEAEDHVWSSGAASVDSSSGKTMLVYKCKFCNAEKKEPYTPSSNPTVTKQEWQSAFDSTKFKNVSATISDTHFFNGKKYTTEYQIQVKENLVYLVAISQEDGEEVYYHGKFQDGNYQWTFESREQTIEDAHFTIVPDSEIMSGLNILKDYGLDLANDFESFTYNDVTKSYEGSDIGFETLNTRYGSVSVKMGYGSVVEIEAKGKDGQSIISIALSSYGTTEPTPPQKEK